jgi:hypothetical protein
MNRPSVGGASPWRRRIIVGAMIVVGLALAVQNVESNGRGVVIVTAALLTAAFLRLIMIDDAERPPGPFTLVATAPPSSPEAATQVRDTERAVQLATATAGDAHRLLRPMVADLVEEWLRATHAIDLHHPDAARLVPAELWAIARPGLPRPDNPHAAGPTTARVADIVDQLESLP